MTPSHRRHDISDRTWALLEPHLPGREGVWGGIAKDNRVFINAVVWILRTGAPWRDLPPELGCWHGVYIRLRRWEARGVWQRMWKNLPAEPFAKARGVLMDSTTVRAHQHAAGAPKKTAPTRLWAALAGAGAPSSTPPRSTKTLAHLPASPCPHRLLGRRPPPAAASPSGGIPSTCFSVA